MKRLALVASSRSKQGDEWPGTFRGNFFPARLCGPAPMLRRQADARRPKLMQSADYTQAHALN